MSVKVFVLGRPGSGKSTVAQQFCAVASHRKYSCQYLQDYDCLYEMFLHDHDHQRFRPSTNGGFDVLDYHVLDLALQQIERNAIAAANNDLVVIEFARDDYSSALRAFHPAFLRDSYFFFIDADIDCCIERIQRRVALAEPNSHFVSEHIMRTYYSRENWEYMVRHFRHDYRIEKDVKTFRNIGSLYMLLAVVVDFAETIFAREFQARLFSQRASSS